METSGILEMAPIVCSACGRVLGNKYEQFLLLIRSKEVTPDEAFNRLGLKANRYCCRAALANPQVFANVTISDLIPEMQKLYIQPPKNQQVKGALSLMSGPKTGPTIVSPTVAPIPSLGKQEIPINTTPIPQQKSEVTSLLPALGGSTGIAPIPVKASLRTARVYSLSHPSLFPPEGKV